MTALRPHQSSVRASAGFLKHAGLELDGRDVVVTDGRGRERRFTVGDGPGQAALLAEVRDDCSGTAPGGRFTLELVDGENRILAASSIHHWHDREVGTFAARAGLRYERIVATTPEEVRQLPSPTRATVHLEGPSTSSVLVAVGALAVTHLAVPLGVALGPLPGWATPASVAGYWTAVLGVLAVSLARSRRTPRRA